VGTDIRAFIEYRSGQDDVWFPYADVSPERDSRVFAAIAGIRVEGATMLQPRGFPSDASASAEFTYYVRVIPDDEFVEDGLEPFIRASEAAEITASGGHYRDETRTHISHPDATCPSWLTLPEIHHALETAGIPRDTLAMEWQITLRILELLANEFDEEPRLVFWFEG
jgi:hypothetical protein